MKVDIFRNIDRESFGEEYQELMNKLSGTLNNNFINIYNALNKNLTFPDNMKGEVKDLRLKVDSKGTPTTGFQFQLISDSLISGMVVKRALCIDNMSTYPISHPFISYTQNSNIVTIKNVTGLQPNTLYELRVEISTQ